MRRINKHEQDPQPVVRVRINDTKPDEIMPTTRVAHAEMTGADSEENE